MLQHQHEKPDHEHPYGVSTLHHLQSSPEGSSFGLPVHLLLRELPRPASHTLFAVLLVTNTPNMLSQEPAPPLQKSPGSAGCL